VEPAFAVRSLAAEWLGWPAQLDLQERPAAMGVELFLWAASEQRRELRWGRLHPAHPDVAVGDVLERPAEQASLLRLPVRHQR